MSDIVSLHVPLSDTTTNLIGAAEFALARPGIVLINTARGGIVDDLALAGALRDGRVAAAGLDVFTTEPPDRSPLLELSNVTLSLHIAGLSERSEADGGSVHRRRPQRAHRRGRSSRCPSPLQRTDALTARTSND